MSKEDLFQQVDGNLIFDGIDLENEIASKYGTPTYLFSVKKLRENIKHLSTTFTNHYPDTEIAYSMKNNMLPEISAIISEELSTFETTSLLEMKLVEQIIIKSGKPLNLISTNLYKSDGFLEQLLSFPNIKSKPEYGDFSSLIAIDSYQDLLNVERVAKKQNIKPKVLIRVNPGIKMSREKAIFASAFASAKCSSIIKDTESIISSSKDENINAYLEERIYEPKFDFAENLIDLSFKSDHLDLIGIHGHLGSQITNLEYFHNFFEVITIFYKLMQDKYENKLEILDLGGGYPANYNQFEKIPTIDQIAESLSNKIARAKIEPKVIIESGRYITASSSMLLTRVNLTKESSSGSKLAVVDLSVYSDLLDVITARWIFESELVNNIPLKTDGSYKQNWQLVGSTNDALDQLNPITENHKRTFPREILPGDLIAIKNTGAYTTCFNSNYSGKPKPLIVLLNENKDRRIQLIRNRS
ncbi:MAG: diaminopimelate decarboxylase family protein [Candidatus Heimdallarchaeota archaeon]